MGHFLSVGILLRRTGTMLLLCATVCLLVVYVTKPATSDLPRYSIYFETGVAPWITGHYFKQEGWKLEDLNEKEKDELYFQHFPNSRGFVYLMKYASKILPHGSYLPRIISVRHVADSLVLLVALMSLALIVIAISLMRGEAQIEQSQAYYVILMLVIILGSVFFFVGSQNSIRQFLGTVFAILAMATFLRLSLLRFLLGASATLIAFLLHPWTPFFTILGLLFLLARHLSGTQVRNITSRFFLNEYIAAFVLGTMGVVAIKVGVKLGIPYFTTYFELDSSSEIYRSSASVKLALLTLSLAVTDLVAGNTGSEWKFHPASLRRCFLIFLVPLVVFPEIFSRISMFYFAAEMIYLVWASGHQDTRVKVSAVLVFCAYGIALNALNILLDREWKEILIYG